MVDEKPRVTLCPGTAQAVMNRCYRIGERFDLCYWDPPFFSGQVRQADAGHFPDRWPSLDDYLLWAEHHLAAMAELLQPTGFLCLHADYHAVHYLKVVGDRVFGMRNFRNEIVWHYTGRLQPAKIRINQKHDTLLVWAKGPRAVMSPVFEPWTREDYLRMKRQALHRDAAGREWIWGHRGRGQSHAYPIDVEAAVRRGRAVDTVWDIPIINTSARERTGYPTQKPVRLLERVVALLTPGPGAWVADFMAGSGTTAAAAVGLSRSVVLGEENPQALGVIRKRLSELGPGIKLEERAEGEA